MRKAVVARKSLAKPKRKSATALKPIKISAVDRKWLDKTAAFVPVAGCEPEWQRYLHACKAQTEADAKLEVISAVVEREGGASNAAHWGEFEHALRAAQAASSSVFGALNAYEYKVKHKDDRVPMPIQDVRYVCKESLHANIDNLSFDVNFGLLGSVVALDLQDVVQERPCDVPLCGDCG